MIRIDENTYIDDTLVTCAEYQLFIDEMREQGKYYQPDHWASYRFSKGQARTPIVGVRFSDAKAFCEWLTKREGGDWAFRLPDFTEVKMYPLINLAQPPLGYWIIGPKSEQDFAWVDPIIDNPRKLPSNVKIILNNGTWYFSGDRDRDFKPAVNRIFAFASQNALDLTCAVNHVADLSTVGGFDSVLDRAIDRNRVLYRGDIRTRLSTLEGASIRAIDRAQHRSRIREIDRERVRDIYLGLYFDIFTLQERIAGRSPAFEGIRLVKERRR